MPRVALVYPYFRTRTPTEMLLPPLGSAMLKSQLAARSIESRIFDCTFSTPDALRSSLCSWEPSLVGIYSAISMSRAAFSIADIVRSILPDCLLVAGGPLPTLYPARFARVFDAVFTGEADRAFPEFCADALSRSITRMALADLPLSGYEGLFISRGNLLVSNPPASNGESERDKFPLPDRSDFDHAVYQAAWRAVDGTRTTSIMTTVGCPYGCDFCSKPVFGSRYRTRSLDSVVREIDEIQDLGYDTLWIGDDSFTLSLSRLQEFCRRLHGRDLGWSCLSRVTGMDAITARMMKEAGCRRVYLGMESGSEETLRIMNKHATVEDGVNAVSLYRDAGIEVAAFFMVGYPGETEESIEKTFQLSLSLPLDYISFNVPYPLPGSRLFERVSSLDASRDWNAENEITFVYKSDFDEGWIGRRIRETMREFARTR